MRNQKFASVAHSPTPLKRSLPFTADGMFEPQPGDQTAAAHVNPCKDDGGGEAGAGTVTDLPSTAPLLSRAYPTGQTSHAASHRPARPSLCGPVGSDEIQSFVLGTLVPSVPGQPSPARRKHTQHCRLERNCRKEQSDLSHARAWHLWQPWNLPFRVHRTQRGAGKAGEGGEGRHRPSYPAHHRPTSPQALLPSATAALPQPTQLHLHMSASTS